MRITKISVRDFLGLAAADVSTDRPLTVVTGANGSGKSTLLQAVNLMRDAVHAATSAPATLDSEWATAGHNGAQSFEVRVGIKFNASDECSLIDSYYRAATLHLLHPEAAPDVLRFAAVVDSRLNPESMLPMTAGDLVVRFDEQQRARWTVGWEFELPHGPAHVQLLGHDMGRLVDGPVAVSPSNARYVNELCPSTNDIETKILDEQLHVELWGNAPNARIEFVVERVNASVQPPCIAAVLAEADHQPRPQDRVLFARVLDLLLERRLQVTNNHRAPIRTHYEVRELASAPSLQDGSLLALELHRLKNGSADDRRRFAKVQESFKQLIGEHIDCTEQVTTGADETAQMVLVPTIQIEAGGNLHDVPLHRAGAGASEALLLATLLADERRCVFLDEPAVHLSPTAQRRLLAMLRSRRDAQGQAVCVTHNPDLVPAQTAEELSSIVRISKVPGCAAVNSLALSTAADVAAMTRLLSSSEVRSLLFAAGVVLFEGATDLAAIRRWLDGGVVDNNGPLPTPDERNVVFLSVDGQTAFGAFADLAERLGVPWAIIADGPAMRPGSRMARKLAKLGKPVPQSGARLADVREAWAAEGIFTLADEFGDDGSKGGELEVFLERLDERTLCQVRRDVGAHKGARVGAAFADAMAVPPEVVTLWAALLGTLGLPSTK
ncbi:AAA family ATPase [Micromonospora sp. C51]|uniref:AAA family ATPase n=1 Tax=Micromonospora sp. C51 TaxID=2824879 RepID=UPI001B39942E|nr:AAA family ATPase [Micromonospora sp. C51]MBQ1052734.1 AAA family ATPase [Micromonospora sp. C51]